MDDKDLKYHGTERSSAATNARAKHAPDTNVQNAIRSTDIAKIRKDVNLSKNEEVIYRSKKITPDQSSLLERPNCAPYPTSQGLYKQM